MEGLLITNDILEQTIKDVVNFSESLISLHFTDVDTEVSL